MWCARPMRAWPRGCFGSRCRSEVPPCFSSRGLRCSGGTLSTEAVEPRARTVRAGQHVTVAAWGEGVGAALQAAEALGHEGVFAEVIDLVSLSPLDAAFLGERVRATGRLVVVHQGDPEWAQRVRQCGLDEAFLYLEAPMGEAPARADLVTAAARSAVTY